MRRTSKVVATTCAAVLLGLATVSGQASSAPPGTGGRTAEPPRLSSKPFSRLFTPRSDLEIARKQLEAVRPDSARRFICGIPILRANPALDPTFIVPPRDSGTRFSMPTVPPRCD